jgi:hypothetical protein
LTEQLTKPVTPAVSSEIGVTVLIVLIGRVVLILLLLLLDAILLIDNDLLLSLILDVMQYDYIIIINNNT